MKRILLYTATGAHNLGDECILKAEYCFLRERYPNAKIRVATYDCTSHLLPKDDKKLAFFSYFPNGFSRRPFSNIAYFFRNIYEIVRSDLVVVWGGGLFYDNEEGQSFRKQRMEWLLRILSAKLSGTKILFWSIGVDVEETNLPKLQPLFSGKNTIVSVRDTRSQMLLRSIGIESAVVCDSAFLLSPKARTHHKTRPKVGLAIRSGYLPNEQENVEKIIRFLKAEWYEPVFLAHSAHPDRGITSDTESFRGIAERLSVRMVETIEETYSMYSELDFVVSMRLHASILSCVQGIPFLALSYSAKTDVVLSDIGTPYTMRAKDFSIEAFRAFFSRLAQDAKDQGFALKAKYDKINAKAKLQVKQIFHGF